MKKEIMFFLSSFFSLYPLTEEEKKVRESINTSFKEDSSIQFIKFEDMVKEVNYMKEKNLSWSLNEENELKTFHSTMHRYIKDNNGAVFIDKMGEKYTINHLKETYKNNFFISYIIGIFILYKIGQWTYYKIKKSFFDDGEFQSKKDSNKKNQPKKDSNKKNQQDDQGRENI